MTTQEAEKKMQSPPDVKYFIWGWRLEDGQCVFDACAVTSQEGLENEKNKFEKVIVWECLKTKP
jgi:hypothetical protein